VNLTMPMALWNWSSRSSAMALLMASPSVLCEASSHAVGASAG
jgi:hypothetical protein